MGQLVSLSRERQSLHCLQEDSLLLQQPLDILHSVREQLSVEDVISFSLSCKDLYMHLFPNADRLRSIDRDDFLVRLEKDIPDRCYCFRCKRLHRISKGRDDVLRDCFNSPWSSTMIPFMGCELRLTYNQARAIMNNHFLGPDHGIQPKKLCQQRRYTNVYVPCYHSRSRVSYTETRKISIIDDELFVTISREYESATGNHGDLTTFVGVLRKKTCGHVYEDFATLRPDMKLDGHPTPGSCGTCLTDWEATVRHQHNSGAGWKVTLISFHQLGGCRSPDDWKWANLATMPSKARLNRSNAGDRTPGSVRRKWTLGPFDSQGKESDHCATVFFPHSYIPPVQGSGPPQPEPAPEPMPAPGPEHKIS